MELACLKKEVFYFLKLKLCVLKIALLLTTRLSLCHIRPTSALLKKSAVIEFVYKIKANKNKEFFFDFFRQKEARQKDG